MKVVIVGGVAGGASAAARLRRLDEHAEIVMFERGEFISFANCGLPYYIGGDIEDRDELELQTPESFRDRFNVDARVLSEVIEIDRTGKQIKVRNIKTGEVYSEQYDKLILSPGAKPIVIPIEGVSNPRVFMIKTIPDTVKVKEYIEIERPDSAVVIGGGYIGIEMAENLRKAGLEVTVVEAADHVIAAIDRDMACDVHNYMRKKGIRLLLSNGLTSIKDKEVSQGTKDPRGEKETGEEKETKGKLVLELQKGAIQTDMVIMAVGVRPESELAIAAGLECNEGG